MVNSPDLGEREALKTKAIKRKSRTALFKIKAVCGVKRYYPENGLAQNLVTFKRATVQQNRKLTIKCLSQREIDCVEDLGIKVEIV